MAATDPMALERPRFSIRLPRPLWMGVATVLLVAATVALRVGLPIYRRQEAILEIERLGGYVHFRHEDRKVLRKSLRVRLASLFDDVTDVCLNFTPTNDASLRYVCRALPGLESLSLYNTLITDAGFADVSENQPTLRELNLGLTAITDASLPRLKALKNLRELYLEGTQVTDAGLVHIRGMPTLKVLWLNRTGLTDAGLLHVKGLTRLEEISLGGTNISDAGLKHLFGLPRLRVVSLCCGTQVTGAGFEALHRAFPRLESP
jgi:hypothetical protein